MEGSQQDEGLGPHRALGDRLHGNQHLPSVKGRCRHLEGRWAARPALGPWPRRTGTPGSPVPGILQARTLEWVAISFSNA